jgi:hypothetical protein
VLWHENSVYFFKLSINVANFGRRFKNIVAKIEFEQTNEDQACLCNTGKQ